MKSLRKNSVLAVGVPSKNCLFDVSTLYISIVAIIDNHHHDI